MPIVRRQSLPELTVGVLRAGLLAGRWGGALPGETKLALELGVGRNTVQAALRLLEAEGLLGKPGPGRSRTVAGPGSGGKARGPLRVGVLLHERMVDENPGIHDTLSKIQHETEQSGAQFRAADPVRSVRLRMRSRVSTRSSRESTASLARSPSRPMAWRLAPSSSCKFAAILSRMFFSWRRARK